MSISNLCFLRNFFFYIWTFYKCKQETYVQNCTLQMYIKNVRLRCKCIMYMYFYTFVWFVFTPFVYYRALIFHMLLSLVLSVWVVHVPVSDMDCVVWKRVFHVAKAFCK
jgi:hypothetical protein